jgi:anthranilate synthase/aminodeoxychorismate synthase-like glutamine amidotransferase
VILVVDHHDSFTWNLVHCLARTGAPVKVAQADTLSVEQVEALDPRGIVLSPGPGRPEDARLALALVPRFAGRVPLLGVCLGHQVLCMAFGARVVHAARLMHGRVSAISHDGLGLFTGLPSPLAVARYHSWIVDPASLPAELAASAFSAAGELMAVRHRAYDVEGVQFHPESFLTEHGQALVARWVARAWSESPGSYEPANLPAHG